MLVVSGAERWYSLHGPVQSLELWKVAELHSGHVVEYERFGWGSKRFLHNPLTRQVVSRVLGAGTDVGGRVERARFLACQPARGHSDLRTNPKQESSCDLPDA
jgi:hypothetical protein